MTDPLEIAKATLECAEVAGEFAILARAYIALREDVAI